MYPLELVDAVGQCFYLSPCIRCVKCINSNKKRYIE